VLRWAAVVLLLRVLRLVSVPVRSSVRRLRCSLRRGGLLCLLLRLRRQLRLLLRVRRLLRRRGGLLLLLVQQLRCRRAPGDTGLWRRGRWAGGLHWVAHVSRGKSDRLCTGQRERQNRVQHGKRVWPTQSAQQVRPRASSNYAMRDDTR
jgi:hypothetical protein